MKASVTTLSLHMWKKCNSCKWGPLVWSQHAGPNPRLPPAYANKQPIVSSRMVDIGTYLLSEMPDPSSERVSKHDPLPRGPFAVKQRLKDA